MKSSPSARVFAQTSSTMRTVYLPVYAPVYWLLCLGCACLLATSAHADIGSERTDDVDGTEALPLTLLVTQFDVADGVGLDEETARETVTGRLRKLDKILDVKSLSEVKSTLDKAALSQIMGGDATNEMDTVSRYVEADRIVYGRIAKVGDVVDVSVRLFHVGDGVMEMALHRRVKGDAALVLTILESLADRLMAYVVMAYTDGAPSDAFAALKSKKVSLKKRPKTSKTQTGTTVTGLSKSRDVDTVANSPTAASSGGGPGLTSVAGGTLVALGGASVGVGALVMPLGERQAASLGLGVPVDVAVASSMMVLGAVMLTGGATLLVVDGLE